jgi:hypothetical protein
MTNFWESARAGETTVPSIESVSLPYNPTSRARAGSFAGQSEMALLSHASSFNHIRANNPQPGEAPPFPRQRGWSENPPGSRDQNRGPPEYPPRNIPPEAAKVKGRWSSDASLTYPHPTFACRPSGRGDCLHTPGRRVHTPLLPQRAEVPFPTRNGGARAAETDPGAPFHPAG